MESWGRIRPRIAQWEATTGRKITSTALRALMEAELNVAAERSNQSQAIGLQREQLALQKKQLGKESAAAVVGGVANLATSGAQLYLLNKYLNLSKPAIAPVTPAIAGTPAIDTATGVTTTGYGGMAGPGAAVSGAAPTIGATVSSTAIPAVLGAEAGGMVFGGDKGIIGKGEKTQAWGRVAGATATGAIIGGPVGAGVGFVVGVLDNFIHGDFGDLFG
jgi:hypothetical protein